MDYRGIPGWGAVDKLADALVRLGSIDVDEVQVQHIVKLYDDLSDFDKKPIAYKPKIVCPKVKGRWGTSKNKSDSVTVIKRLLSSGLAYKLSFYLFCRLR